MNLALVALLLSLQLINLAGLVFLFLRPSLDFQAARSSIRLLEEEMSQWGDRLDSALGRQAVRDSRSRGQAMKNKSDGTDNLTRGEVLMRMSGGSHG